MDVEAGDPQRLLQRLAQRLGGRRRRPARHEHGELVLADAGQQRRSAGRRRPGASPGPPAPGRPARGPGPRSGGAGGRRRPRPAHGRPARSGARRPGRGRSGGPAGRSGCRRSRRRTWSRAPRRPAARSPSSSQTPRQMQVSPPRMRRRTAISPPSSWGLRMSFGQGAVLRHGQGGEGGGRAFRRQRAQAQGAGGAGEPQLVVGRRPDPQRGVGGGQRLDGGRGVPRQGFWIELFKASRRLRSGRSGRPPASTSVMHDGRTADGLPNSPLIFR